LLEKTTLDEQDAPKFQNEKVFYLADQFAKWDAMKGKHHKRGAHRMHKKCKDKIDGKKECSNKKNLR
jgi:hypothetical protein